MTIDKIEARAARETKKYEVAKQIRALLDQARKEYGPKDWDEDDLEGQIIELVVED